MELKSAWQLAHVLELSWTLSRQ